MSTLFLVLSNHLVLHISGCVFGARGAPRNFLFGIDQFLFRWHEYAWRLGLLLFLAAILSAYAERDGHIENLGIQPSLK